MMYSNNIGNFQGYTTILNACTKKVWKLIEGTTYLSNTNNIHTVFWFQVFSSNSNNYISKFGDLSRGLPEGSFFISYSTVVLERALLYFTLEPYFIISGIGLVWFDWVLWHINHCRLFNVKSIFMHIKSSISNDSV